MALFLRKRNEIRLKESGERLHVVKMGGISRWTRPFGTSATFDHLSMERRVFRHSQVRNEIMSRVDLSPLG